LRYHEGFPLREEFAAFSAGKVFPKRKVFAENRTSDPNFLDPEAFPVFTWQSLRDHPVLARQSLRDHRRRLVHVDLAGPGSSARHCAQGGRSASPDRSAGREKLPRET